MTTMERHINDLQAEVRRLRELLEIANHTIDNLEATILAQLELRATLRKMDDESERMIQAPKKYLSEKYSKVRS